MRGMKFKFDQIAINSTAKKKPEPEDAANYIGLEHLTPGTFEISEWGSSVAPVGEKLLMKKGDVLFGRRRAYQRKVGIAPFDGIFSAHGMVLRPRTEVVDESFFPFFISSDQFMNEAVRISVGSLSPTINWGTLKNCEFDLPPMEEQKKLAELLWAANDLKEKYKKAITATDEMLKAKFQHEVSDYTDKVKLSDIIDVSFSGEWGDDVVEGSGVYVIRTANFTNEGFLNLTSIVRRNIDSRKVEKKRLLPGDILLEKAGGTKDNPVGRVVWFSSDGIFLCNNFTQVIRFKKNVDSKYLFYNLYYYYLLNKKRIRAMGHQTTGIQNLNIKEYLSREIKLPTLDIQKEFVAIAEKAESAKTALKKSIAAIDQVMKGLING